MKNIWTVTKREIQSYFTSPIAYVILAVFVTIAGYFFIAYLYRYNLILMQAQQYQQAYGQSMPPINVNMYLIRPLLMNLSVVSFMMVPMITMRLIAEEKKNGTLELLITSPMSPWHWITGKYLASLFLFAVMLLPPLALVLMLNIFGNPELLPVLSGFLGLLLLGGSFLAIGLVISSLTENQIIAATGGFGAFLMLWVIDWIAESTSGWLNSFLTYISMLSHFDDFAKGIVDVKHIVFYLSFIIFGLFLTYRSIESIRWRV